MDMGFDMMRAGIAGVRNHIRFGAGFNAKAQRVCLGF